MERAKFTPPKTNIARRPFKRIVERRPFTLESHSFEIAPAKRIVERRPFNLDDITILESPLLTVLSHGAELDRKKRIERSPFVLKPRIERRQLYVYEPVYKGALEGFSVNYITHNMWKVQDLYELPDLMQDAFMLFLKCKAKYCDNAKPEERVNHPAHFMALYKTTLVNHVTVLANESSSQRQYLLDEKIDYDYMTTLVSKAKGDDQNAGYLNRLIEQAPEHVREIINLVTNKRETLEKAWNLHRESGGKAETGNVFLCKCLGLNPLTNNVVREIKDYFER